MENNKKSICELCEGIGLIKNKNMYCMKCESSRCEYTRNISKDEFYKYKFCEFCVDTNKPNINQPNSSPKTHCLKCLGEGYYLNLGVVCNACEIPHRVCNCIIKLFEECEGCYGSGTNE
jgi:hypothetical protein